MFMPEKPPGTEVNGQSETIHEFDPADCITPDDNRAVNDAGLTDLLPSVRADGQLVAGIVSRHPTLQGKLLVVAGCRRKRCCELIGIPFRPVLIDRVLPRAEIIRIRVKENVLRKNPKPFELCTEVCDYKAERGLETWTEVGEELNLLPAAMSRITSVRHIPPELKTKAELVCPSVCWLIASLKKHPDAMRRAFDFASTPGPDGKLPSRDAVRRYIEPLKKGKKPGQAPAPKALKGTIDGRPVQIGIKPDDSTDTVIEWLRGVAAKMAKYRDLPPDNLAFLFGHTAPNP
jgi:hypothetical protein